MSSPIVALVAFVFAVAITPGPTNAMVSASGANFGYRRSMPFILGTMVGLPGLIVAVGLGLDQAFQAWPPLQVGLSWAGSAYLLYLAWRVATAGRPQGADGAGRPLTFVQAALFQWINPKAWLAAVSALGVFAKEPQHYLAGAFTVAGVFFLIIYVSTTVWCLFGSAVGRLLASPRALTAFNVTMGVLIAASIVLLHL